MTALKYEAVTAFHMIPAGGQQAVFVDKGTPATLDGDHVLKQTRHVMLVGDTAWRELPVALLFRRLPGQEDDTEPQLIGDEVFLFRSRGPGTNNWTSCTRATFEQVSKLPHVETMITRPVKKA